ncbi:hypothetical protein MAR_010175 [Mya arenaria]|uniref:Uncharacterized protein n=1 Tax=Mya arenaria TaxID=6604 RepID=A0ABY7E3S2_MYAAR|nr:hypothetical protein MAR_010175 [Mya arenaria]
MGDGAVLPTIKFPGTVLGVEVDGRSWFYKFRTPQAERAGSTADSGQRKQAFSGAARGIAFHLGVIHFKLDTICGWCGEIKVLVNLNDVHLVALLEAGHGVLAHGRQIECLAPLAHGHKAAVDAAGLQTLLVHVRPFPAALGARRRSAWWKITGSFPSVCVSRLNATSDEPCFIEERFLREALVAVTEAVHVALFCEVHGRTEILNMSEYIRV